MHRAASFGVVLDSEPTGPNNLITDVPGVLVGHCTLETAAHKTGVTAVLPGSDNPFSLKYVAAAYVLNGFGKSAGLMQIQELGTLETPILLTNTLNVGKVHDALVSHMLGICASEGIMCRSVNPVVLECNDSMLSDISRRVLGEREVQAAIRSAGVRFALGSVGAGRGTTCFGFKGGIGSASRQLQLDGKTYTVGVLVQSNHGRKADLIVNGKLPFAAADSPACDKGSVIVVLATDVPLSCRQLGRVLARGGVGLARMGSFIGQGSGEVFVGFSTANRMPSSGEETVSMHLIREDCLDVVFRLFALCVQEAVFLSMLCAGKDTDRSGKTIESLAECLTNTKA